MIICKTNSYAYCGDTPEAAYAAMLASDDDIGDIPAPEQMEWFTATSMKLKMALEHFPKVTAKPAKK